MTVSTTDSVKVYVSGGPAFPIDYRFLQDEDIQAVLIKPDGSSETLVIGTQYTLTGSGAQNGGTLTSAYAASFLSSPGSTLTISRVMNPVQPTDLRNQGRYFAETHENVFDRLTMLIQQAFGYTYRALLRPIGKSYFDAEGRRIANVADPSERNDAANRGYVEGYVAQIISSVTGPMNLAQNVGYAAPEGTVLSVAQALDKLNRCESFADMRNLVRGDTVFLIDWHGGWNARANPTPKGGGVFKWNANSIVADNGGTICKLASVTTGRLYRVIDGKPTEPTWFGAMLDGVNDDTSAMQASINWAQDNGECWHHPGGNALCTSAMVQTKRLHVTGAGRGVSTITRQGSGNGWTVTAPAAGAKSRFWKWSGISIVPSAPQITGFAMQIVLPAGSFMSNFDITDMEFGDFLRGLYLDNSAGNVDGFFTGVINRNWIQNGLLGSNVGDSMSILDNTITGQKCGIEITGVSGARQYVIDNNNITTQGGAIALISVDQCKITHNQLEHPGYQGDYNGIYGAHVYLASCFKPTLEHNTINPANGAAVIAPGTIVCDGSTNGLIVDNNDIQKGSVYDFIFAATTYYHIIKRNNRYYGRSAPSFDDQSVGTRGLIKNLTPLLLNGWIKNDPAQTDPSYLIEEDGSLLMTGILKGGTGPICTMPVGARPFGTVEFSTVGPTNTTPTRMTIMADGVVTADSATNTKVGLNGINYLCQ